MGNQAIICDLDGTLCNIKHRLHFIQGGKKDWASFFAEIPNDSVNEAVLKLLYANFDERYRILFVSGRPESTREMTVNWLFQKALISPNGYKLYMRKDGDYRPDYVIKEEILNQILAQEYEILYAIDDREVICDLWRSKEIFVFQVKSHWDSEFKSENLGRLTLLVGPCGSGKSSFVYKKAYILDKGVKTYNCHFGVFPENTISSDHIRHELFGDFRNQSDNEKVFTVVHKLVKARITSGLPGTIDATNLRRSDRRAAIEATGAKQVRYLLFDRPLEEKVKTGGWRNEIPNLIERQHQRFQSSLKEIKNGDGLGYEVIDLRNQVLFD